MTLDSDLGVMSYKGFLEDVPLDTLEPLAERAERVDACRGAIFSRSQAEVGIAFFVGVIVGDLGGTIISAIDVPQKVYSYAPILFALFAFSCAVSLSFYRICLVQGCCSRKVAHLEV